jgi:hypothetical protein
MTTKNTNKVPTTTAVEYGKEVTVIRHYDNDIDVSRNLFGNCCICDRKAESKSRDFNYYVHLSVNGYLIPVDHEIDSQGFFIVGPECQKRLPANFIEKF